MKLLIPFTILVVSFILYSFFAPSLGEEKKVKKQATTTIQSTHIAPAQTIPRDERSYNAATVDEPRQVQSMSMLARKAKMRQKKEADFSSGTLSLDDLRVKQKSFRTKINVSKNFNQEVFAQLKTILQQSSSTYYAKKHIVLNSRISSILHNTQARERFIALLSSDFGLDEETLRSELSRLPLVWDWVRFLAP